MQCFHDTKAVVPVINTECTNFDSIGNNWNCAGYLSVIKYLLTSNADNMQIEMPNALAFDYFIHEFDYLLLEHGTLKIKNNENHTIGLHKQHCRLCVSS